jgi:signal recognition particle receptor subunit beta
MLGYVLLIDASRPESLDESVSILSAFKAMAHVPFVIGYNRADILDDTDEGRIRGMLDLDHDVPIVACDVTDRESVKAVLLALLYAVVESLDTAAAAQA